jgi:hypothetical protein
MVRSFVCLMGYIIIIIITIINGSAALLLGFGRFFSFLIPHIIGRFLVRAFSPTQGLTNLDIIHCPVFYLSKLRFRRMDSLRLQVEPTQMGPTEGGSLRLRSGDITDNVQNCDSYTE